MVDRLWLKYVTSANFLNIYDHVNTLLGPLPGPRKGPWSLSFIGFMVNPPLTPTPMEMFHTHTPQLTGVAKVASSSCTTVLITRSHQLTGSILRWSLIAVTTNKRTLLRRTIQHTECTQSTDSSTTLLFSFGRPHCHNILSSSFTHMVQFHKASKSPKNTQCNTYSNNRPRNGDDGCCKACPHALQSTLINGTLHHQHNFIICDIPHITSWQHVSLWSSPGQLFM